VWRLHALEYVCYEKRELFTNFLYFISVAAMTS
jgi:hypothetical protein